MTGGDVREGAVPFETGGETHQVDAFRAEAGSQTRAEERGRDRCDHLWEEERPVLRAGEVVLRRIGEDRARGREGDERDALHDARCVDDHSLRLGRH